MHVEIHPHCIFALYTGFLWIILEVLAPVFVGQSISGDGKDGSESNVALIQIQ